MTKINGNHSSAALFFFRLCNFMTVLRFLCMDFRIFIKRFILIPFFLPAILCLSLFFSISLSLALYVSLGRFCCFSRLRQFAFYHFQIWLFFLCAVSPRAGIRKYVVWCLICGGLSCLLGIMFLGVYFLVRSYTSTIGYFETVPTFVPATLVCTPFTSFINLKTFAISLDFHFVFA